MTNRHKRLEVYYNNQKKDGQHLIKTRPVKLRGANTKGRHNTFTGNALDTWLT